MTISGRAKNILLVISGAAAFWAGEKVYDATTNVIRPELRTNMQATANSFADCVTEHRNNQYLHETSPCVEMASRLQELQQTEYDLGWENLNQVERFELASLKHLIRRYEVSQLECQVGIARGDFYFELGGCRDKPTLISESDF